MSTATVIMSSSEPMSLLPLMERCLKHLQEDHLIKVRYEFMTIVYPQNGGKRLSGVRDPVTFHLLDEYCGITSLKKSEESNYPTIDAYQIRFRSDLESYITKRCNAFATRILTLVLGSRCLSVDEGKALMKKEDPSFDEKTSCN